MIAIVAFAVAAAAIAIGGVSLYLAASPWALLMWPAFLLLYAAAVAVQRHAERDEADDEPAATAPPSRGRHRR